ARPGPAAVPTAHLAAPPRTSLYRAYGRRWAAATLGMRRGGGGLGGGRADVGSGDVRAFAIAKGFARYRPAASARFLLSVHRRIGGCGPRGHPFGTATQPADNRGRPRCSAASDSANPRPPFPGGPARNPISPPDTPERTRAPTDPVTRRHSPRTTRSVGGRPSVTGTPTGRPPTGTRSGA